VEKDYQVKLNMKVGLLKFINCAMLFENMPQRADGDNVTLTSCNTEFRNNKRFLTNLREKKQFGALDQPDRESMTYYSSVRDTISKATTPRTPHSHGRSMATSTRSNSMYHAANPNPQSIRGRNLNIQDY